MAAVMIKPVLSFLRAAARGGEAGFLTDERRYRLEIDPGAAGASGSIWPIGGRSN